MLAGVGRCFCHREIIEVAKIGPTEFDQKFETLQDRFTYEVNKNMPRVCMLREKKLDQTYCRNRYSTQNLC